MTCRARRLIIKHGGVALQSGLSWPPRPRAADEVPSLINFAKRGPLQDKQKDPTGISEVFERTRRAENHVFQLIDRDSHARPDSARGRADHSASQRSW